VSGTGAGVAGVVFSLRKGRVFSTRKRGWWGDVLLFSSKSKFLPFFLMGLVFYRYKNKDIAENYAYFRRDPRLSQFKTVT
jgi:hypothetical protein